MEIIRDSLLVKGGKGDRNPGGQKKKVMRKERGERRGGGGGKEIGLG